MALPDALAERLWQDIEDYEGSRKMAYITSVEKIGLRKGIEQGRGQVLLELLTHRFGPLPKAVITRVEAGTPTETGCWARRILEARALDEVFTDDESVGQASSPPSTEALQT